ncbi:hypothetical protein C8F01DRAFT_1085809 [Mycena amicta]|nr:hypothetical protein C8F01DRAFT_1085809 [Mycena amicta]
MDLDHDHFEDDTLEGRTRLDISHAREGRADVEEAEDAQSDAEDALLEGVREIHRKLNNRRATDRRNRFNRTQKLIEGVRLELEGMTNSYMEFSQEVSLSPLTTTYRLPEGMEQDGIHKCVVVDLYAATEESIPLPKNHGTLASCCVRQGLIPCSVEGINVVITTRSLEFFRRMSLRCPRLGVQAFVRSLCDLHGVAPRPYLASQFRTALDIYLAIRDNVERRVKVALGRDSPNYRLENACPACMYKLEGEDNLEVPILFTIDGNNSLKRFMRRTKKVYDEEGVELPGRSKERYDDRPPPGDYYLPREQVDKWAKEGMELLMAEFPEEDDGQDVVEEDDCNDERWKNMREEVTSRALGIYDETGIMPALCRHSFVLTVVDMVKSGKMYKYGFAIVNHLIRVLGPLGLGYDVGCTFGKAIRRHPVLGPLARRQRFQCLVGAFHGPGHSRRCQCKHLPRYRRGVGLEPFESCESYFSKSNALSTTTRYASRFHRHQAIVNYMQHSDTADAYAGLSNLLARKYEEALRIKATEVALDTALEAMDVSDRKVLETWVVEEEAFLTGLKKEPEEETLQMEYFQSLVTLLDREAHFKDLATTFNTVVAGEDGYTGSVSDTRRLETKRRHMQENLTKALDHVHTMEQRLGISKRWEPADKEWVAAAKLVKNRRFHKALDELEGLIVARMFELNKCHMSGTGYKLRMHIAKSLQARSKAVKSALERYNTAASALVPPRRQLTWEEAVKYAFISDFDLLRDGREDIREKLWAQPKGRAAMDAHFKLLRADEEIQRLNIEIRRLVTYMADESAFLQYQQRRLVEEGKEALAHQVGVYRMERERFDHLHMRRLTKLNSLSGFTGCILPGVSLSAERRVPSGVTTEDVEMANPRADDDTGWREDDESDGEDQDTLVEAMEGLLLATEDG